MRRLIALSTGNVVVFWLFTRALFDETFKLRWWHALVWAAVAVFSFVNCMWLAPASGARLSVIAINLIALGFIALAVGADRRVLVVRSGRTPPPRSCVHRQRRGPLWRA